MEAVGTDFLWYPYIPLGKITIMLADPGVGKTTLCLKLASIVSRGEHFYIGPGAVESGAGACDLKEESAILQHEHGRGADAPGIYKHDTRAADRDGLLPGRGICAHDNARLSCCRNEFIYTDMCGGKIRHFGHPKKNL